MTAPFVPDSGWFAKIVEPEPEGWLHKILHASHPGPTLQTVGRGEVRSSAAPAPSLAGLGRGARMYLGGAAKGAAELPGQIADLASPLAAPLPPDLMEAALAHTPDAVGPRTLRPHTYPQQIGDFVGGKPITAEDSSARAGGEFMGNLLGWELGARSGLLGRLKNVALRTEEVTPEKIIAASIRSNGRYYTGANHGEAILSAHLNGDKGFIPSEDQFFLTSRGRHVSRQEAVDLAKQNKSRQVEYPQISQAGYDSGDYVPGELAHRTADVAPKSAFTEVEPAAFDAALKQLVKEKPSEAGFITWRTPEEMHVEGMRTFLGHDGKVGYAIHPETGDIRNVFNAGGPKGAGAAAVADAVQNGGTILDAFDTRLTGIYRDLGFKETWRSPWKDEFRPAMWDEAKHGTPDVIGMEYAGGTTKPDEILAAYEKNRAARKTTPRVQVGEPERELVTAGSPSTPSRGPGGFGINGHIPDQESLTYHLGPESDPVELMNAYHLSREAFDAAGPANRYLEIGRRFASSAPWYDSRSIFRRAANVLGDTKGAREANDLLGGFVPAVTAKSAPANNLLRSFLWRRLVRDGIADPSNLLTHHFEMPKGFGHLAQGKAHQPALARYLETGEINPARNPKPASFGHNLTGNAEPATFDTVIGRILRALEPSSGRFFSGEAPKMWAYEPLERGLADAGHDAFGKGLFDVPHPDLSPAASYQSILWHGATPSAKQGSMSQIYEGMVGKAAKQWGVTEAEADRLIWSEGAVPGLPLDAAPVQRVFPFDR